MRDEKNNHTISGVCIILNVEQCAFVRISNNIVIKSGILDAAVYIVGPRKCVFVRIFIYYIYMCVCIYDFRPSGDTYRSRSRVFWLYVPLKKKKKPHSTNTQYECLFASGISIGLLACTGPHNEDIIYITFGDAEKRRFQNSFNFLGWKEYRVLRVLLVFLLGQWAQFTTGYA